MKLMSIQTTKVTQICTKINGNLKFLLETSLNFTGYFKCYIFSKIQMSFSVRVIMFGEHMAMKSIVYRTAERSG